MKSFLAVDFGAGSVKLAEFEVDESGGLKLKQYGIEPLGAEGGQEATRAPLILKALQKMLAEKGIKAKDVNVCAPGFQVFSKFVKLPPVESNKVTQIIQYEAQQNVPFPLEEVVWDYQIMGALPSGELEVLLVAIKADVVERLFNVAESSKLRLQLADVSPAALCNAFRYNYGDLEDCTMLLDIGAKTSNLLFFEKGKVFSRSINIGANSITQDFASEAKLAFPEAEKIKIAEGFVSLGGAYEEPENPHQAAISKIARQFMTRLHIQVNQTMQFYRGQQGGSAPQRLFLSGGASIMPYTAQFFAEKLNIPVEYFNPLRNVQIDPAINLEELARVAHSLGEVIGLGLRNLAHCPVELNLMPDSTLRWQSFNQKKPYLIATVFSLVLVVCACGLLFEKLANVKQGELATLQEKITPIQARADKFKRVYHAMEQTKESAEQVSLWMADRFYWADTLTSMRKDLMRAEEATKRKLNADVGVWIERFDAGTPLGAGLNGPGAEMPAIPMPVPMRRRAEASPLPAEGMSREAYNAQHMNSAPTVDQAPPDAATSLEGIPAATGGTNEINSITLTCRAVSLGSTAKADIAFAVLTELQADPLFVSDGTAFTGNVSEDEPPGTFTFGITVKLKRPLKP
ncbi:MAG TPA: type IV pilus assembly protein PilM [Dongiaceae bacterium]|nr:type IV pilus assembly protein PilM [Dongiaceae bacterium]